MIMEWIDVKAKLPEQYEEVLVWIKYDGDAEFQWNESWLDVQDQKSKFAYKEPVTNKFWAMGSAKNYVITYWMPIVAPK